VNLSSLCHPGQSAAQATGCFDRDPHFHFSTELVFFRLGALYFNHPRRAGLSVKPSRRGIRLTVKGVFCFFYRTTVALRESSAIVSFPFDRRPPLGKATSPLFFFRTPSTQATRPSPVHFVGALVCSRHPLLFTRACSSLRPSSSLTALCHFLHPFGFARAFAAGPVHPSPTAVFPCPLTGLLTGIHPLLFMYFQPFFHVVSAAGRVLNF